MRILGVDPGISITGFSIIDVKRNIPTLSAYGTIKSNQKDSLPKRLNYLFEEMNKILDQFNPDILSIEDMFYSKNVKSAMVLGQARGAIILSATQARISISEFAPRKVKMSVCGNGAATKEQVAYMVTKILKLKAPPKPLDVSDAMAVGLCYINQSRLYD